MNMMRRMRDIDIEPVHCITCRHWMAIDTQTGVCWKDAIDRSAIRSETPRTDPEDSCADHCLIEGRRGAG